MALLGNKATYSEHTLELPVLVNYGYTFNDKIRAFVYAGPEFSLALAGTATTVNAKGEKSKTNFYAEPGSRRFNLLITGGIGVDLFKMVQLTLGYSYGCISKSKNANMHDSHLKLGVAYLF